MSNKLALITYINVHVANQLYEDARLFNIIKESDIIINDSAWLSIISTVLYGRNNRLYRNTITDVKDSLFNLLINNNSKVYFIGNTKEVMVAFTRKIIVEYPTLNVIGAHHGFFDSHEEIQLINDIIIKKPDFILVGMGVPNQEYWYHKYKDQLNCVVMMCGNCFGYWSGHTKRAPIFLRNMGLEWLYRYIQNPIKMFDRYIIGNPLFLFRYLRYCLINGKS